MDNFTSGFFDIVVTSPPYNLNIKYENYKDDRDDYLSWLHSVFTKIHGVLKKEGSFFLNVGCTSVSPWVFMDVANQARDIFQLQNDIIWVKSISINDTTHGHFKPINSNRFLNHTYEHLFHFTKTGNVPIHRNAIGVPYVDKSNIKRWKHNKNDKRCRGNCWFIPYKTIRSKLEKGTHPAIFPVELAEMCIKLHGYNKDTQVYDPFSGSGSTMLAAKRLGVNAIGTDIDKNYVEYSRTRLRNGIAGIQSKF